MSQTALTATAVADFLSHNPHFFLEHEYLLRSLQLPHPRSDKLLSLAERQTFYLRQQNQQLEQQLQLFLNHARKNELIQQAIWRWATELLAYQGPAAQLTAFASQRLQAQYGLQEVQLRLWGHNSSPFTTSNYSEAARRAVEQLHTPYTGPIAQHAVAHWFEQDLASMALIPLYNLPQTRCIGALALGSDKVQRFTHGTGTEFLQIMAQVFVAALARFHEHTPETASY